MRFQDQVAIVTGSGRGIGRAALLGFAREGAKVVINDVDEPAARAVLREVETGGGQGIVCPGSVTDRTAVKRMVDETVAAFGTIDILVNNAAVLITAMIPKMTEEQWDRCIEIDLKGVFNCLQAVAPVFTQRAEHNPQAKCNGKVVNVTSVAGLRGTIGSINYAAAKAGVIGMTMSAAKEWGRYRVNVNAVAFGIVETRMTEGIRGTPKIRELYEQQTLVGYFATTDDVAPTILFLASADANYVTGHVLNVTGGLHIGF